MTAVELAAAELHGSVADPVLRTMTFLNEIMARYPDAISFAPGAPHDRFLDGLDVPRYLARYAEHLTGARGLDAAGVREALYQYGPSQGLIADLVAEALRRDQGIDVPARAVVITVGAQEALFVALRTLCSSGPDLVAVMEPAYPGIVGAARLLDLPVLPIADPGRLGEECEAARRAGRRVRVVYAAPDFANPSGAHLDLTARRALLAAAARHELLVLEDSAYGFTASAAHALPSLKALDTDSRVLHVGTFAKICLPGARVGYVVADQVVRAAGAGSRFLAEDLAAVKSMITLNTSPVCQALVAGMLLEHGGSLAELGREKAAFYRRNLRLLLEALYRQLASDADRTGVWWNEPAGGFFVRMGLPVDVTDALLERSAREYGVLWTPMSYFTTTDVGRRELRLSCSYLDPAAIEEGVARLARFIRAETAALTGEAIRCA